MPFAVVPTRDRTLHRVLRRYREDRWPAGTTLWSPGDPASTCLQVVSGLVTLHDDRGRTLEVVGPGELAGIAGLVAEATRETGAIARVDSTGVRPDGAAVLRALRRGIHTLPLLMQALREETRRARAVAAGSGGRSAAERLATVMAGLVRRFGGGEGELPDGLTHALLGELAGLHRSTVTTLLNAWIWEDLVEQEDRRIRVPDVRALVDRVGGAG